MSKQQNNKSTSIRQYKRKQEFNIGILIFAIIFVYLIVMVFTYTTKKRISPYEVREGSVLKDHNYVGLALRDETVVYSESGGYIYYFQNQGSKVKAGSNLYAISPTALKISNEVPQDAEAIATVSNDSHSSFVFRTQSFNESYNSQRFSYVYSFKNELINSLSGTANQTKIAQMDAVVAGSNGAAAVFTAVRDGILVLKIDGMEDLTKEAINEQVFNRSTYNQTSLEDQMQVAAGAPVYKMVTSENWSVMIPLEKEDAAVLSELSWVKVKINKDTESIWAEPSVIERDGKFYGCLDLKTSMIRYADNRYLNIELILEDQTGLKIPKSAVVEKAFYVVPEEYITTYGKRAATGVMVMNKDGQSAAFQETTVYNMTPEGECYLNPLAFPKGTTLVKPDTMETIELKNTRNLKGVYNINKGYAVFRQVTILSESDDYYIIQEGDKYGLCNYDHIVQDGASVKEEEIVI